MKAAIGTSRRAACNRSSACRTVRVPLQHRDLRRVDDVAHVDVPALHVHLGEVADAEVAERVRAGRGRKQPQSGEGDSEEAHDHPCAFETRMVLRLVAGRLQQDV